VTAPVVFVGHGLQSPEAGLDDYANLDVKGKIVLLLSGYPGPRNSQPALARVSWPRTKERVAAERGAAGVIYVRCTTDIEEDQIEEFDGRMAQRPLSIPVVAVTRAGVLRVAPAEFEAALQEDPDAVAALKGTTVGEATLKTQIVPSTVPGRNVVGMLRGSDPVLKDEYVVIGGHYDHEGMVRALPGGVEDVHARVFNGADDNASGSCGVIAAARALAAAPELPRRSIIFICFDGEEEGLFGSQHYVSHPLVPLEKTVAMIDLDMIGRLRDDHLTVYSAATSPGFAPEIQALASEEQLSVSFDDSEPGGSDHESFISAKVPAVFFFTGLHPQYHTVDDDYELLNIPGELRVLDIVELFARELADADKAPEFVAP
jgi:aminopeptidase YwaD